MYDVTIVGCGVVGASIAYTLAQYRLRVLLLERENDVAMGTTKANSAIVHAGYDPAHGTLMAQLNVRGAAQMEALCRSLAVGYKRIGSLVLAFSQDELAHLQRIYENGAANGVPELALLTREQTRALEPNLSGEVCGALHAPTAAVIDPWGLCLAQAEVAVRNGVTLKCRSAVQSITDCGDFYTLDTASGTYESRYIVNCAGVHAAAVAAMVGDVSFAMLPTSGQYYLLDKQCGNTVSHIIFQCPTASGKGVLIAPTVHGNLIVGPSAEPCTDVENKATTDAGLRSVAVAARRSVPTVDLRQSIRNFTGIRAVTDQPDFILRASHASARLLLACGIKSPGLSAVPAIADYCADLLSQMGLSMTKRADFDGTRAQLRFKSLCAAEKTALAAENPLYGRVVCRCETITEGEIVAAIHSLVPPCSIDGIKRRAGAGMGRCQGGFCAPRVLAILARELGVPQEQIQQDQDGTYLIVGQTRTGEVQA